MRVRKGHSSSSDSQERTRMRKQMVKDASDFPSGSGNENTQGDEALDDRDSNEENSSSLLSQPLTKGRTRRENAKSKAMTEEEMMDLALRLSEQEASVNALRLQKEEEAVRKAIQESMASESQSQSLIDGAEDSLCSRRKLLYSKEKPLSAIDQGTSEDGIAIETDMYRGAKETGGDSNNRLKKRKKKEGSPLLEMPDLSQTQNIFSQASPCSSEPLELILDSQLSPDLTQIDDHQLGKSPVFPLTGCRAEVHVPRLSQSLVKTCSTSGFVLCSQDSITPPPQVSLPAQPNSPTFPNDPKLPSHLTVSKSQVFSETDQGEDEETQLSPECFKSPVFGGNPPCEASPSACSRPQDNGCNSGITFSSQESLISSVTSTSCQPKSPVFLKSPGLPKRSENCKSPVVLEIDGGQTKPGRSSCTSPVFDRTEQQQNTDLAVQEISASPSEAEVTGSDDEGNSTVNRSLSGSRRQDSKTDHNLDVAFINKMSESDDAEEPKEKSQNWASVEMELTSDMALLLSDEDDDVTPVGSPSPVFPEERPVHRADSQAVPPSLNHKTEASPEVNGSNCSPPSSPTPADRQQPSTTERPTCPFSGESAPPVESAGGPTVHYYWGVPFCPRGLDPDEYTQVIVAQMEVYEKSLKKAQRLLLRKAEWGEAVLPQPEKSPSPEPPSPESPQPAPRRLGLRRRSRKLREAADDPPADGEEEEEEDGQKEEREEERESTQEEEEEKKKKNEGDEEGQVDIDDCEVCPETQLSDDDRTQDLMIDVEAGAELQPKSPERPEVEMILQKDSPAVDEQQDEDMEVDMEAQGDRLTKRNIPVTSSDSGSQNVNKEEVEEERRDQDVEEISHRRLQRSASPELELTTVPQSPESKVDCPICQGSFPVTEIEMHAAYCDGEVKVMDQRKPEGDCFQVSLKPRRKRSRRGSMITEETDSPSNTGKNQERCYICQKAVPLGDYVRHTELCFQRQASSSAGKGNLLSALEQTESRDSEAGPSGSKLQRGPIREVIDLRDDDDDEEEEEATTSVSALGISNSPIRSFTPISEATDCLIDFKKQRTKKLSQRRR